MPTICDSSLAYYPPNNPPPPRKNDRLITSTNLEIARGSKHRNWECTVLEPKHYAFRMWLDIPMPSEISSIHFLIAQVEELHLLHLHTILVSQTLGVMSSEELQSSAAPVCRHDMAPYVAKVTLGAEGYEMQVYGLGCHPSKVSRTPF